MDELNSWRTYFGGVGAAALILGSYLTFKSFEGFYQMRNPEPEITQAFQTLSKVKSLESQIKDMKSRQISFLEVGALIEKDTEAVDAYKKFAGEYKELSAEYEQLKNDPETGKAIGMYESNEAWDIGKAMLILPAILSTVVGAAALFAGRKFFRRRENILKEINA